MGRFCCMTCCTRPDELVRAGNAGLARGVDAGSRVMCVSAVVGVTVSGDLIEDGVLVVGCGSSCLEGRLGGAIVDVLSSPRRRALLAGSTGKARWDLRLWRSIRETAHASRSTGVRFAAWRKASCSWRVGGQLEKECGNMKRRGE